MKCRHGYECLDLCPFCQNENDMMAYGDGVRVFLILAIAAAMLCAGVALGITAQ